VLGRPIALQRMKPIARRHAQDLDFRSAASIAESLRSARRAMSGGSRRILPVTQNCSVCLSANVRIMT